MCDLQLLQRFLLKRVKLQLRRLQHGPINSMRVL